MASGIKCASRINVFFFKNLRSITIKCETADVHSQLNYLVQLSKGSNIKRSLQLYLQPVAYASGEGALRAASTITINIIGTCYMQKTGSKFTFKNKVSLLSFFRRPCSAINFWFKRKY